MTENWFLRVAACTFFLATATDTLRPAVSYKALEFGAGAAEIGALTASYSVIAFLVAIPIGHWLNRIGEGYFLIFGAALMLISSRLLSTAAGLYMLGIAFAGFGAGQILVLIALQVLVANGGNPLRRDHRFSGFAFAGAVGQMTGPLLGGFVTSLAGNETTPAFFVGSVAVLGILGLSVSLQVRKPARECIYLAPRPSSILPSIREVMGAKSMPQATLAGMLTLAGVDVIVAFMPLYGQSNGLSPAQVGVLLSLRAAGSALSRILMVPFVRTLGRRPTFVLCLALPASALPLVLLRPSLFVLMLLMVLSGMGLGLGLPMSLAWMGHAVPSSLRGVAVGVRMAVNSAGQTSLPVLVGAVGAPLGTGAVFAAYSLLLAAGAIALAKSDLTTEEVL